MSNLENTTITVYILASRQEARYADAFWTHLALMRRQLPTVTWVSPLYVEDMVASNAIVPALPKPFIVIGCLSPDVVSAILDQPALRELVEGARLRIPFIFSPCSWDQPPCPFRGLMPIVHEAITTTSRRDSLFVQAMGRIRGVLIPLLQEI
jgi:hypothetical protein